MGEITTKDSSKSTKAKTSKSQKISIENQDVDHERRDFITITAGAFGCIGLGAGVLPLIKSMNPAADALALSSIDVDLKSIPVGKTVTVMHLGKPVFIRHRTPEEIKMAQETELSKLPDPQEDKERVQKPEWLVVVATCTHLGCIPNQDPNVSGGLICPCHGSYYDPSGRILRGPAPANLKVPKYAFLNDHTIRIG